MQMIRKPHIGELIKKEAERLNITQTAFAKKLNRDRSAIGYMYKQPSIDFYKLLDVCTIFNNYDFIKNWLCSSCALKENDGIVKVVGVTSEELEALKKNNRIVFDLKLHANNE